MNGTHKADLTSEELSSRILEVNRLLGRPLRVLHIGNIANNAYLNSKLLNEYGVESHVLCYDYYHVMGTPEWEDAFFDTNGVDHFRPQWRDIDLGGFDRPNWYCQGPLDLCLSYLEALQAGDNPNIQMLLWRLARYNATRRTSQSAGITTVKLMFRYITSEFVRICRSPSVRDAYFARFPSNSDWTKYASLEGFKKVASIPFYAAALVVKRLRLTKLFEYAFSVPRQESLDIGNTIPSDVLISDFQKAFPQRSDQLGIEDINQYRKLPKHFESVMKYYDVVHAYATDPIIPMILGRSNYVAYEHGTIRSLPFLDKPISRLTALAYHRAAAIISTNADCLTSARKLQPDQSRIVRGLHGFDERQVLNRLDFAKSHHSTRSARFNISSEIALFLHPARQDWGIKGNDLLLEAIVELRKDKNLLKRPFVVVLAEWGNDVQKAKEFIRRNRIDDFIQWTEILSKTRLIHAVAEADAIIDQFKIPCIGAIPAEFLTVSRGPLITNLDDEIMSAFYGETLPILKAATPSEIAMNMRLVINDDEAVNKSVRASKDWVKRNHSHLVVLSKCLDAYDRVLSSNSSDGQK